MQRRRVLRGLAALAAGAAAGCTGADEGVPVTAPEPPAAVRESGDGDADGSGAGGGGPDELQFGVPDRTFDATADGDLLVLLTVENRGEQAREATVAVTVSAGEKTFTPTERVALDAGASTELRIVVPVPYSEFDADPGFDVTIEPGPPATPLPEGTVTPYPEDRETATAEPTESDGSTATESSAAAATAVAGDNSTTAG